MHDDARSVERQRRSGGGVAADDDRDRRSVHDWRINAGDAVSSGRTSQQRLSASRGNLAYESSGHHHSSGGSRGGGDWDRQQQQQHDDQQSSRHGADHPASHQQHHNRHSAVGVDKWNRSGSAGRSCSATAVGGRDGRPSPSLWDERSGVRDGRTSRTSLDRSGGAGTAALLLHGSGVSGGDMPLDRNAPDRPSDRGHGWKNDPHWTADATHNSSSASAGGSGDYHRNSGNSGMIPDKMHVHMRDLTNSGGTAAVASVSPGIGLNDSQHFGRSSVATGNSSSGGGGGTIALPGTPLNAATAANAIGPNARRWPSWRTPGGRRAGGVSPAVGHLNAGRNVGHPDDGFNFEQKQHADQSSFRHGDAGAGAGDIGAHPPYPSKYNTLQRMLLSARIYCLFTF